jgi:uncharacterized Zn finger protein (UPF0148 family)
LQQPGHFTGGVTAEQVSAVTGKPLDSLVEDKDFGTGFCPNCGTKGKKDGVHETLPKGKDPYDDLHQQIAERVEDPSDKLTMETSQDALEALVAEREEGNDAQS